MTLQLLHVLSLIWDQCNVDVFLMDWEKPKGNVMAMIQEQQFMQQQQQKQQPQFNMMQNQFMAQQQQQQWSLNNAYGNQQPNPSAQMSPTQHVSNMRKLSNTKMNKHIDSIGLISCWRKLFVANEWNELCVHRNIQPKFTFLVFLLLMVGCELEFLSLEQPVASGSPSDSLTTPTSMVFKFLIASFFFIVIFIGEYLYFFFVNDRFCASDPFIDLIDLASLANISIFVLDRRYHGFYIHGKTIHQHSDTSLEIINENIESERKKLCKSRGLLPDRDTFEIFVSAQFRQQYDEIYRDVLQYELSKMSQQRRVSFDMKREASEATKQETDNILLSKQLIESSKLLSMFLSDFIEKSCPHAWELRELVGFERFFGPMPNLSLEKNCLFYDDLMCKFKSKLMRVGLQYDVAILWILTFCFVDHIVLSTSNTVISILMTYILDSLLVKIRSHFGERNVSRKTMIDEKFLL